MYNLTILSVCSELEEGVYRVLISEKNSDGVNSTYLYISTPNDSFGLSPAVREAVNNWIASGGYISPYEPPTPEELRAQMSPLTPRQFRDALIDADIMPDDVTAAINQVPDEKQRAKALNAWNHPTEFTRTDPLIDQIGAMFDLSPDDIDLMWEAARNEP